MSGSPLSCLPSPLARTLQISPSQDIGASICLGDRRSVAYRTPGP